MHLQLYRMTLWMLWITVQAMNVFYACQIFCSLAFSTFFLCSWRRELCGHLSHYIFGVKNYPCLAPIQQVQEGLSRFSSIFLFHRQVSSWYDKRLFKGTLCYLCAKNKLSCKYSYFLFGKYLGWGDVVYIGHMFRRRNVSISRKNKNIPLQESSLRGPKSRFTGTGMEGGARIASLSSEEHSSLISSVSAKLCGCRCIKLWVHSTCSGLRGSQ